MAKLPMAAPASESYNGNAALLGLKAPADTCHTCADASGAVQTPQRKALDAAMH